MTNDVTGRKIVRLAEKLIRQLKGATIAEAKDALDYAATFLDQTQIVRTDSICLRESRGKNLGKSPQ